MSRWICLFGVLRRFQHCTGHITMGSWKGRGNQYIQFVMVLYCKLPTNGKQLPAFPLEAVPGIEPRPQRWEARVLPLCHRGPLMSRWKNRLIIVKIMANRSQKRDTCPKSGSSLDIKRKHRQQCCLILKCPLKKGQVKNKCLEKKTSGLAEAERIIL